MSEFNGVDIQGNTGMMQQGSPMVIGGVNQPVSGLFVLSGYNSVISVIPCTLKITQQF